MKQYDSGIKDLSIEILDSYIKNNKYTKKKDNLIKNIISDVIAISAVITMLITNNKLIIMIGIPVVTISTVYYRLNDNKLKKKKTDINPFFIKKMNRDYYTDDYKETLEYDLESEEERKFRTVIQKQQKIELDNKYYNKDDTMRRLVYEMDILYDAYDLPELSISNKEWDIYFNRVNQLFINNGIEVKFYEYMESVMRFAFAKAMVNANIEISKNEFIEGLDYLKVCDDFKVEDIDKLKEELNTVLNNHKITSFNEYKKRLTRS